MMRRTARFSVGLAMLLGCSTGRPPRQHVPERADRAATTTATEATVAAESLVGEAVRPIDAARAAELDRFVAAAMTELEVPGAAVAVVQRGQVVYEKAFGVRALGGQEPVTAQTLFMMGSVTKPMTTMMQAALVDDGRFTWETPVTALLPGFALGDAALTAQLALWHTSCACTGMPQRDMEHIFEFDGVTPEQRIASMQGMTPTTRLGEAYQYSNLMVAAGGYAAAHAFAPERGLTEAYAAAMQAKIFGPIGMTATTLDFAAAERADHALPHALAIDGVTRRIPLAMERDVLTIAPAGGAWSNLRDMERYAMTEMARGVAPDGTRVVSEANLTARWKLRIQDSEAGGYGLGLGVDRYGGLLLISHDGGSFGFGTTLFLLPEQETGIVILTNIRNGGGYEQLPFNAAVRRKIVELAFAGARDEAAPALASYVAARRGATAQAGTGVVREPDAAWLQRLAGRYTCAQLGRLEIRGAVVDVGEWQSAFGRRTLEDGTVQLVLLDPPFAGGVFLLGGDEAHPTLTVPDPNVSYLFARVER